MTSTLRFGPFEPRADERRVLRDGVPVHLGASALDVAARSLRTRTERPVFEATSSTSRTIADIHSFEFVA
jgi:hypothetical protein